MHHKQAVALLCDTLKVLLSGTVEDHHLADILDMDLEQQHKESMAVSAAITKTGDAMPGFGIVAAVLGVIITMGSIGGAASEIGEKVAAALVGTFLGILLSYGVLGPDRAVDRGADRVRARVHALHPHRDSRLRPRRLADVGRRVRAAQHRAGRPPLVRPTREADARGHQRKMTKPAGERPIIIKKIRKSGHAHHGGSWKVAYADFVTAMMAFFMVLWIVGMDEQTRKSIEGYFSNPAGYKKAYGSGSEPDLEWKLAGAHCDEPASR